MKAFAWNSMTEPDIISNVVPVEMEEAPLQPITYTEIMEATNATVATMVNGRADIGLEQAIMSLARKDRSQLSEDCIDRYYDKVVAYAQKQRTANQPWSNKATEVERVILALASLGVDPADVGGTNLYDYIWNKEAYMKDHDGNPSALGEQGLNELTFGLLALDALPNVKKPDDATISRDDIMQQIYKYKTPDGGFGLNKGGQSIDINMTAMTLQAIAPYYLEDDTVKNTVDKAVFALSTAQAENGDFKDDFAKDGSVESLAQVLVALSTLGIDADTDSRFIKNGNSVLDALLVYYDSESGGFKHTLNGNKVDSNATQQALYALVAYDRFQNDENTLYDMSDITIQDTDEPTKPEDDLLDMKTVQNEINSNEAYVQASEYAETKDAEFAKKVTEHKTQYDAMDAARLALLNLLGKTTTQSKLTALLHTMNDTLDAFEAVKDEVPIGIVSLSIEGEKKTLPYTDYNLYQNDTAWDVFQRACEIETISYNYSDSEWGFFLESIPDYADGCDGGYWGFDVNNSAATVGAENCAVNDGDHICFRYCVFFGESSTSGV